MILAVSASISANNGSFLFYMPTSFTFESLMEAAKQCSRGVKWKDSIANWVHPRNLALNCLKLFEELDSGTYRLGGYVKFRVTEPKERIIRSPRFRDRVVQRAMCNNGLYDDLTRDNIYDNGACQKGKGTHFTMRRLSCHLQRFWRKHGTDGWFIKADVHKFFDSIPHDKLKEVISTKIRNPEHLRLVNNIIDSFDHGIGLGSQISQLLAINYLSGIDHYFKETLKLEHYIRYSDDIVIIHHDYEFLVGMLDILKQMLNEYGLELNPKTKLANLKNGIMFMKFKYIVSETGGLIIIPNNKGATRIAHRLRKLKSKIECGEREAEDLWNCFNCWKAHASFGKAHNQIERLKKICQE